MLKNLNPLSLPFILDTTCLAEHTHAEQSENICVWQSPTHASISLCQVPVYTKCTMLELGEINCFLANGLITRTKAISIIYPLQFLSTKKKNKICSYLLCFRTEYLTSPTLAVYLIIWGNFLSPLFSIFLFFFNSLNIFIIAALITYLSFLRMFLLTDFSPCFELHVHAIFDWM